jgi:methylmalonyl-CoA/ethylmalonyl-CoA epimerase
MIIDHIGIVVSSIDNGIQQWQKFFGYHRISEVIENTRQKVKVVFLDKADSIPIKLIEPSDDDSPVSAFSRRGGGLHHLCFRCDDNNVTIPFLREKGAKLIVPPQPGEAFNGKDIAFFLIENNLNIELIDTTEKQRLNSTDHPTPTLKDHT